MAVEMQHFPTFSYVDGSIRVGLDLSRFYEQFKRAQLWLGNQVLHDCRAVMPLLTGSMQQRSYVNEDGSEVVFPGPYARFQYGGLVMVDPVTGSPWARAGVKKVLTDRPLTYSRAEATDHWFDTAKAQHGDAWIQGVKDRSGGGK